MEVIFLLGAAQAFFLAFLVLGKKHKSTGDYVLCIWMGFIGLHLMDYYLATTGFLLKNPHLLGIGTAFPMLQGPFMFVYVLTTISKTGRFRPVYILHGLPFFLFTLYFLFNFYFLSAAEKLIYFNNNIINLSTTIFILSFPNIIVTPVYAVWSLIKLRKHEKNIANNFSYTEQISLKWLKYVIGGLGFLSIVVIVANILGGFSFLPKGLHENIIYYSATVAVFFLGYFGIKQQAIYDAASNGEDKNDQEEPNKVATRRIERYKHSGLKEDQAREYLKKLQDYIENEKPYLNGKLSLKEVAEELDISVNHLSQVINEKLGKSFFDFINEFRIEEVKSRLINPKSKQFTILTIAYDSGFNSKSSFNNIFKKYTGLTPSQYLKRRTA